MVLDDSMDEFIKFNLSHNESTGDSEDNIRDNSETLPNFTGVHFDNYSLNKTGCFGFTNILERIDNTSMSPAVTSNHEPILENENIMKELFANVLTRLDKLEGENESLITKLNIFQADLVTLRNENKNLSSQLESLGGHFDDFDVRLARNEQYVNRVSDYFWHP